MTYHPTDTTTMHGLQEIIYANREVARKHKARALRKRAERAQQVIAERIASSRGLLIPRGQSTQLKEATC